MLILYSGNDAYRLRRATADAVTTYRTQFGGGVNTIVIDGSTEDAGEQIERPLKYTSFFGDKTIMVVRNAAGPAMADILKRYRLSELDDIVCIAVQDTEDDACVKKVLSALESAADRSESFVRLTGARLAAWANAYCSERGSSIEPHALTALAQRTNGDTQILSNELEKLSAYAGTRTITLNDVTALVPPRYERDEWELSNALASHDKRAAIGVLWRRLQEGVSEQLLLGSIAAGIRNLSMVKDMQQRHQPSAAIASKTGLHPFVVSKTIRGAASADTVRLTSAHRALARLDRDAKSGRTDMVDGMFSVLLSL
jgi:DNA polymerase III delta subunit